MALIKCPECSWDFSSERLSNRLFKRNITCGSCGYDLGRWKDIQDWKEEKEAEAEFDKRMKLDAKKLGVSFEEIKKSFTNKHGYFNYEGYENKIKERFQKIKDAEKRQRLIRNGDPEIDYNKFQELIKKCSKKKFFLNVFYLVLCLVTIALQITFQIPWAYFFLTISLLPILTLVLGWSPKKIELEHVFGSNICKKFSYSWDQLHNYYLGDLSYSSNFKNVKNTMLNSADLEKELLSIIELGNKSCTKIVDKSTRLDYMEIDENGFVHHVASITSSIKFDKTKFKKSQSASVAEKYNSDYDLRFYKDNNIKIRYTYNDKHNKQIVSFVIP